MVGDEKIMSDLSVTKFIFPLLTLSLAAAVFYSFISNTLEANNLSNEGWTALEEIANSTSNIDEQFEGMKNRSVSGGVSQSEEGFIQFTGLLEGGAQIFEFPNLFQATIRAISQSISTFFPGFEIFESYAMSFILVSFIIITLLFISGRARL